MASVFGGLSGVQLEQRWDLDKVGNLPRRGWDATSIDGEAGSGLEERLCCTQNANLRLPDRQARVTTVVSTVGEVVEPYLYDAYGRVAVLNGAADADPGVAEDSSENNFSRSPLLPIWSIWQMSSGFETSI